MSDPDYLISTPENVDLHLEFAGVGNRILACLIDTLISYLSMGVLFVACYYLDRAIGTLPLAATVRLIITVIVTVVAWIASFIIYFGYFIYFEIAWQGQTPGKKIAGIRVIEQNGQPVSRSSVLIRNLLRTVDEGILLIGLLVMIVDRNERRLGVLSQAELFFRTFEAQARERESQHIVGFFK